MKRLNFRNRRSDQQSTKGFTLVEVLVALGIFALLSSGYLIATSQAINGLGRLQDKIFALWIAEDTVTQLRTIDASRAESLSENTVTFLEREWRVSFKAEATDVESLRRVTIYVAAESEPETPLATLESYFHNEP